jgi:hypothetical protein
MIRQLIMILKLEAVVYVLNFQAHNSTSLETYALKKAERRIEILEFRRFSESILKLQI